MSLLAPKDCREAVFQYCNYGYDKSKYSSREDCLNKRILECGPVNQNKIPFLVLTGLVILIFIILLNLIIKS